MLYWQKEFSASEALTFELIHECERCGRRSLATVLGYGEGHTVAPFGLGREGAEGHAQDKALEAAEQNAAAVLQLVPCPDCGWRPTTLRPRVVWALCWSWLTFLALGLGSIALERFVGKGVILLILLAAWIALRVGWSRCLRAVWHADQRVEFGDPDPSLQRESETHRRGFHMTPEQRERLAEKRRQQEAG